MVKKSGEGEQLAEVAAFTKEQILSAKKFRHRQDVLNVVLKDGGSYSLQDVDDLIAKFMKEKVK